MTISKICMIDSKLLAAGPTDQFTSNSANTQIDSVNISNISVSNQVVSIYLVPSGGTPGDSNKIMPEITLFPNGTYACPQLIGKVLKAGGKVYTECSNADTVNINASATQFS